MTRHLQPGDAHGSDADFGAGRARERRHATGRFAGHRIDGDGRAARVVAVEAEAGVDVDLGLCERSKDRAAFRADEPRVVGTAVLGDAGVDVEAIAVDAHAGERPQPRRPLGFVLREGAGARLEHRILADCLEPLAARACDRGRCR